MSKRTSALAIVAALIAGFWIGWVGAYGSTAAPRQFDPIVKARDYAIAHYPKDFSGSADALSYIVEEHGDVWTVEVAPQAQMGGGLRLMIRRGDGHVELVGLTQ